MLAGTSQNGRYGAGGKIDLAWPPVQELTSFAKQYGLAACVAKWPVLKQEMGNAALLSCSCPWCRASELEHAMAIAIAEAEEAGTGRCSGWWLRLCAIGKWKG